MARKIRASGGSCAGRAQAPGGARCAAMRCQASTGTASEAIASISSEARSNSSSESTGVPSKGRSR